MGQISCKLLNTKVIHRHALAADLPISYVVGLSKLKMAEVHIRAGNVFNLLRLNTRPFSANAGSPLPPSCGATSQYPARYGRGRGGPQGPASRHWAHRHRQDHAALLPAAYPFP